MGGFDAEESLTERVRKWHAACLTSPLKDTIGEILAVLEGRLMIDDRGILRAPCEHTAGKFKVACRCLECGQLVPNLLAGELAEAALRRAVSLPVAKKP